ncbi:MAG: hypothetical protein ACYDAY_03785 [Candidatus Dormibacteria bacterium]
MKLARLSAFCLAAIGLAVGAATPAFAHTYTTISGFQIINGGYVGAPVVGARSVPDYTRGTPADPQANDGTMVWTNLDPVNHLMEGYCVDDGSGTCDPTTPVFDVNISAGGQNEICGLPLGQYVYGDPAYSWMKGAFNVNSQGTDSGCDNGLPVDWPRH